MFLWHRGIDYIVDFVVSQCWFAHSRHTFNRFHISAFTPRLPRHFPYKAFLSVSLPDFHRLLQHWRKEERKDFPQRFSKLCHFVQRCIGEKMERSHLLMNLLSFYKFGQQMEDFFHALNSSSFRLIRSLMDFLVITNNDCISTQ